MTSVKALCSKCYLLKEGIIKSESDTGSIIVEYLASDQRNNEYLDQSSFSCNTGAVVIKSIMLLNFNGTRRSSLFHGGYQNNNNIECPRSVDGILAAVYLNTKDGVAISFGCSNDNGTHPTPEGCCSLEIEAKASFHQGNTALRPQFFKKVVHPFVLLKEHAILKWKKLRKKNSKIINGNVAMPTPILIQTGE